MNGEKSLHNAHRFKTEETLMEGCYRLLAHIWIFSRKSLLLPNIYDNEQIGQVKNMEQLIQIKEYIHFWWNGI